MSHHRAIRRPKWRLGQVTAALTSERLLVADAAEITSERLPERHRPGPSAVAIDPVIDGFLSSLLASCAAASRWLGF